MKQAVEIIQKNRPYLTLKNKELAALILQASFILDKVQEREPEPRLAPLVLSSLQMLEEALGEVANRN